MEYFEYFGVYHLKVKRFFFEIKIEIFIFHCNYVSKSYNNN